MDWSARWIWHPGEPRPRNQYVCFRKSFPLNDAPRRAELRITADSRYRLFVNGEWIGDGPPRSWPWKQTYDSYDVGAHVQTGDNVIAVLVAHYGESTFQYILGRGGLLCELRCDDHVVGSDATWKVRPQRAYARPTPRISCQMPFEEQFDARLDHAGWERPGFNDTAWSHAVELGEAGIEPWTELIPRDIPFLTRDPVAPARLIAARAVRATASVLTLDTRSTLLGGDLTANMIFGRGVYATEVVSPARQRVEIAPHASDHYRGLFVNGRAVEAPDDGGPTTLVLRKGSNLLTALFDGNHHWSVFSLALQARSPLEFRAPGERNGKSQWLFIGPFGREEDTALHAAACAKSVEELLYAAERRRIVAPADHIPVNVYNIVRSQRALPGAKVRIDQPEALLSDNADWTTVQPLDGDVELLIDFGKEVLGYRQFELDAPAGTIVDWLCFEAIEDGRIHFGDGNQNSMRYVCREGRQTFTSFLRHGFRYAFVTLRQFERPVRLRYARVLQSTYNAPNRGMFRCSDPLLNQIWELGRYTLLLCAEDTFTDCPGYEQTYWVGDGRNEALISYATWGPTPLAARCVELPAGSLARSPLPESQVPSGWQDILPAWFMLWIMMAEEHYLYSGDLERLKAVYPAVKQTLEECERRCTHAGLFSIHAWNLFDWAPQDIGSATVTHNNMLLVGALDRAASMARTLKEKRDEAWYRAFRDRLVRAINAALWSRERNAYVDCLREEGPSQTVSQHCNSLALLYDIAPPERARRIRQWPADPPADAVAVGSPFAMFYIFETLAKQGRHDAILAVVREKWKMMLDKGATTCWETFPGFDSVWWTRSHCHAWSSAPTYFLTAYQLGVKPLEPGCARVLIAPQPVDLDWAEGVQPTPRGDVEVAWRRDQRGFSLRAALPAGVAARLELPVDARKVRKVRVNGTTYTAAGRVPKLGEVQRTENRWVLEAKPGVTVAFEA